MQEPAAYDLPWSTAVLWRTANETIATTLDRHHGALKPVIDLAYRIRERLEALEEPISRLCNQTCSRCRAICCCHAHAYFDFKDLIFLHMGDVGLPAGQTLGRTHQTCRYLAADGCRLPRIQRPFICTWYLCADQKSRILKTAVSAQQFLFNSLKAIKSGRTHMETLYVQKTVGPAAKWINL